MRGCHASSGCPSTIGARYKKHTYLSRVELKSVGEQINSSNIAATFELSDYLKTKPSPSLLKREAEKNHKYSRLITVAQKQTKDKKRLHCPSFNSFIVSDYGDVSPAAIELQEWLLQPMQRSVSVKEQELMDAILQT